MPQPKMMRRTIEIESSQFSPNAYWVHGSEYYAELVTVEYPARLDGLLDYELLELVDDKLKGVKYVESEGTCHLNN